MEELKLYQIKFRTGYDPDPRYYRCRASNQEGAETQVLQMYGDINTEFLGCKNLSADKKELQS